LRRHHVVHRNLFSQSEERTLHRRSEASGAGGRPPGRSVPNLILVGGGHAHVIVLESMAKGGWPPFAGTLISPDPGQLYSGMVPGYLQSQYREAELTIDLPRLCEAAGVRYIQASVDRIDAERRVAAVGADSLPFSVISVDVGSVPAGLHRPGVREHAIALRPLEVVRELRERVDWLGQGDQQPRIAVVGAGPGGLEIALAIHRRLTECGIPPSISILERGERVLPGYSRGAARKLEAILARRGITLLLGVEAIAVEPDSVRLAGGSRMAADLVVWVGGAAPPPLLAASSALPTSARGYLAVDQTLRSLDGGPVFGAGDCVDIQGFDLPKAGVYAVRQGPVLAANLKAALAKGALREYWPQNAYLSILNTADQRALLHWRGIALHSRWAWRLKDWIDRRFVERY
jgi:selenide, water dikinase